jgi:hypothetical protein
MIVTRLVRYALPVRTRVLRLLVASGAVAALLVVAGAAQARSTANPTLRVNFFINGTIAVSLPDGTPVGTASGSPTVIPAGYYTLQLIGPGGCANIPYFELKGPGESIVNNLTEGELDGDAVNAYFQPNSSYTWRNREVPGTIYTFQTSAQVLGSPPAQAGPGGLVSSNHDTVSSSDLAGSAIAPFRGTLTGAVSAAGRLTLAFKGKGVTSLKAGRYTIAVIDRSASNGFMLQKGTRAPLSVTGAVFVGKRSASIRLTVGKWIVAPRLGKTTYSITVN